MNTHPSTQQANPRILQTAVAANQRLGSAIQPHPSQLSETNMDGSHWTDIFPELSELKGNPIRTSDTHGPFPDLSSCPSPLFAHLYPSHINLNQQSSAPSSGASLVAGSTSIMNASPNASQGTNVNAGVNGTSNAHNNAQYLQPMPSPFSYNFPQQWRSPSVLPADFGEFPSPAPFTLSANFTPQNQMNFHQPSPLHTHATTMSTSSVAATCFNGHTQSHHFNLDSDSPLFGPTNSANTVIAQDKCLPRDSHFSLDSTSYYPHAKENGTLEQTDLIGSQPMYRHAHLHDFDEPDTRREEHLASIYDLPRYHGVEPPPQQEHHQVSKELENKRDYETKNRLGHGNDAPYDHTSSTLATSASGPSSKLGKVRKGPAHPPLSSFVPCTLR